MQSRSLHGETQEIVFSAFPRTSNFDSQFSHTTPAPSKDQSTKSEMATPTERKYEFFVTTDEPHQPDGIQRNMIRRLVMRNYFDTKMAETQSSVPEHNSTSTATAKKQLKSRFRLSEPQKEKRKNVSKVSGDKCEQSGEKGRRPQVLRTRSGPIPSSSSIEEWSSTKNRSNRKRTNINKRNTSEPTVEKPSPKIDPSAHRIDPFDALPIPGTPQLDALFRLCTYDTHRCSPTIELHLRKRVTRADTGYRPKYTQGQPSRHRRQVHMEALHSK